MSSDAQRIVIRDVGHDRGHRSVTNDAAEVVAELAPSLRDRRLLYFDSTGMLSELRHDAGRFIGFAPVTQEGAAHAC